MIWRLLQPAGTNRRWVSIHSIFTIIRWNRIFPFPGWCPHRTASDCWPTFCPAVTGRTGPVWYSEVWARLTENVSRLVGPPALRKG